MHELLSVITDAGHSPGAYGEYLVLVWKGRLSCKVSKGIPSSHPHITPKS